MRTVLLLVCLLAILPIPTGGQIGAYNTLSGWYYCTDELSCLHEQAHYLDYHNGGISGTQAFREAAVVYILTHDQYSLIGYSMSEMYAWIYADCGGDVPDLLKPFYPSPPVFRALTLPKGTLYYGIHIPGH